MNANTFNRLHSLRMANDQAGFDMAEMRPRFDRIAHRHENGTAPRAVVVPQLFQTPPDLAARLVALLGDIPAGATILEPSAGLGRILDALAARLKTKKIESSVTLAAVEMAADCAQELFNQDRPNVRIRQRDFLTCTPAELGLFDFIAMNPPFTMRADVRHILHARQFLKPGGRLAALCFDTPERHAKLKPLCSEWQSIPAGTFKHEGTNVPTALLLIENK